MIFPYCTGYHNYKVSMQAYYIAEAAKCSSKHISKLLNCIRFSRSRINQMWILKKLGILDGDLISRSHDLSSCNIIQFIYLTMTIPQFHKRN